MRHVQLLSIAGDVVCVIAVGCLHLTDHSDNSHTDRVQRKYGTCDVECHALINGRSVGEPGAVDDGRCVFLCYHNFSGAVGHVYCTDAVQCTAECVCHVFFRNPRRSVC